jgi:hypothetical protein
MANATKKLPDADQDSITVYSFSGSIIIPTEQGAFWATAIGGEIESRPIGNPYILFALKYLWDVAGQVSEFPEPIRIRLNTAMAVTETFNFKFPEPQAPTEEPAQNTPLVGGRPGVDDEDDEIEEGDEDGGDEDEFDEDEGVEEIDEEAEVEDELAKALHSDSELDW